MILSVDSLATVIGSAVFSSLISTKDSFRASQEDWKAMIPVF